MQVDFVTSPLFAVQMKGFERIDPLATRGPIPVINIFKGVVLQAPINVALGIVSMPVLNKPAQ